jgi:hypothetical protein
MSPDTIIPNPGDHQAYNRYAYVRNNPIMLNDPSGHGSPGAKAWMQRPDSRAKTIANDLEEDFDVKVPMLGRGQSGLRRMQWLDEYLRTGKVNPDLKRSMARHGFEEPEEYFVDAAKSAARHERHGKLGSTVILTAAITLLTAGFAPEFTLAGGLISAGSAAASTAFLEGTGEGRQLVKRAAKEVVDDVFGVNHQGTAMQISSTALHMGTTAALEHGFGAAYAELTGKGIGRLGNKMDKLPATDPTGNPLRKPTGFGANNRGPFYELLVDGEYVGLVVSRDVEATVFGYPVWDWIGANHQGLYVFGVDATSYGLEGFGLSSRYIYSSAVCHQLTSRFALSQGIFLSPISAARGSYSAVVTTLTLGTFGNQLFQNIWYANSVAN